MNGISIIVVTWNCEGFIRRFVEELRDSLIGGPVYEVLFLDNASTDGTADYLEANLPPNFSFVRSTVNSGFAKGNNTLIRLAKHEHIVLLNPDVFEFSTGFWNKILDSLVNAKADVGFVRLNNEDGSFQDCIGEYPSAGRAIRRFLRGKVDPSSWSRPTEIDVGIMAFMVARKDVFDEVGEIDEDFHMYCEDVEWCFRAKSSGKKLVYFPGLQLTHIGGASASIRWTELSKRRVKLGSERLFIRKHYRGLGRAAALATVRIKMIHNWFCALIARSRGGKPA